MNHWDQYLKALPKFEKTWARSIQIRTEHTAEILENPEKYKLCLHCASTVPIQDRVCRFCHAYRFSFDAEVIQFIAVTTKLTRPTLREIITPIRYGKEHQ